MRDAIHPSLRPGGCRKPMIYPFALLTEPLSNDSNPSRFPSRQRGNSADTTARRPRYGSPSPGGCWHSLVVSLYHQDVCGARCKIYIGCPVLQHRHCISITIAIAITPPPSESFSSALPVQLLATTLPPSPSSTRIPRRFQLSTAQKMTRRNSLSPPLVRKRSLTCRSTPRRTVSWGRGASSSIPKTPTVT
jgi:hypothetical protein